MIWNFVRIFWREETKENTRSKGENQQRTQARCDVRSEESYPGHNGLLLPFPGMPAPLNPPRLVTLPPPFRRLRTVSSISLRRWSSPSLLMVSLPEQEHFAVVVANVSNELKVRVRARYSSFIPYFLSAAIWEESITYLLQNLEADLRWWKMQNHWTG